MVAPNVYQSRQTLQFIDRREHKMLGVIALATDLTSEQDFARIIPHDKARFFTTRVAYQNPSTPENMRKMEPRLADATDLILPGIPLDAICFSCTAASVVIGDESVERAIHNVRPNVPVVTPTGAARKALTALEAGRIAILTPYLVETSEPMAEYFHRSGFEVTRFECFGIEDDRDMARVTGETIVDAVLRIDSGNVEAFFVSCTALPSVAVIAEIEARTGKPVVTSNQASAWSMMRLAGLDTQVNGFGRLFECGLPAIGMGAVA